MSRRIGNPSIGAVAFAGGVAGGNAVQGREPRDLDGVILQYLAPESAGEGGPGLRGSERRAEKFELDVTTPDAIWVRFAEALVGSPLSLDLDKVGLDAHALSVLPAETAFDYTVIPVRAMGEVLILAVADAAYGRAVRELPPMLGRYLCRFALADADDIRRAVRFCYDLAS